MRLIGGVAVLFGLLIFFVLGMFCIVAKGAPNPNDVMGAADQSPAMKRLSECQGDKDCAEAYDAIWGEGESERMDKEAEKCHAPAPGMDCPVNINKDEGNYWLDSE